MSMEKKIIDTLNGALNKQLIDNFVVARRIDGTELSEKEIMQLTRPYFRAAEISEMPATPVESYELHWEETPVQKQFGETIKMAVRPSEEAEAARMFVGTVIPMCDACSEKPGGKSMSLYNAEQMIVAFIAGQQWLRERIARRVPLDTITAEGAMNVLKDILYAIPKGWSIEQTIEHLKQLDDPKKEL